MRGNFNKILKIVTLLIIFGILLLVSIWSLFFQKPKYEGKTTEEWFSAYNAELASNEKLRSENEKLKSEAEKNKNCVQNYTYSATKIEIKNKRTGDVREVSMEDLEKYGLNPVETVEKVYSECFKKDK